MDEITVLDFWIFLILILAFVYLTAELIAAYFEDK